MLPTRSQLALARLPAAGRLDPVEAFGQAVGHDLETVDGVGRRLQQVAPPHFDRVEPEFGGHGIEQRLEGKADIDRAVAAHGAAGRRVGIDAVAVVLDRRNVVEPVEQRARVEDGDQAVAAVGAASLHHLGLAGGQAAFAGHAQLHADMAFRPAAMGEETFLARHQQAYRATCRARQHGADDLEIQRFGAMAETAADERLDDPYVRRLHLQAARQRQMHVIGHLRHRPQGQMAALRVIGGEGRVGLHHRVMDLGALVIVLAHQVGRGETRGGIAELVMHGTLDIVGLVVVQRHGIRLARFGGAEIGRQFAHAQADQGQRGVGRHLVDGGNGSNRIADVTHTVARQRELVLRNRDHAVGHVAFVAGDHGTHPGQGQGLTDIDFQQFRMGVGTAQDLAEQRAAGRQVGRVARRAGHLFDAVDEGQAGADAARFAGRLERDDLVLGRVHAACSTARDAASTDSMILT
jgi:hypothetical protein